MPSVILECPHCGAERIGFELKADALVTSRATVRRCRTILLCSNCEEAVIAAFESTPGTPSMQSLPSSSRADPSAEGWRLTATYPKPQPSKCPSHSPDYLKRLFLQAANALKRGDPDASGAMSRKVLDVSTQQLLGDDSRKHNTIQARIEALARNGKLTDDLKAWAHEIRLGGNDASHDIDPFTMPEAEELLDFAELYLTYIYSLPGRLAERRAKTAAAKAAASDQSSN